MALATALLISAGLFTRSLVNVSRVDLGMEQVFNWPGMGRLAWQAALDRDYPVLLGITLVAALVIPAGHMLKEATQVAVNPQLAS